MFSVLVSLEEELNLENAIDKLTHGPRRILGQEFVEIKEGSQSRLSLFDPTAEWVLDRNTNKSKSANSPFWGKPLKGKAIGIVVGDRLVMNS
jgi:dihydroorotase